MYVHVFVDFLFIYFIIFFCRKSTILAQLALASCEIWHDEACLCVCACINFKSPLKLLDRIEPYLV